MAIIGIQARLFERERRKVGMAIFIWTEKDKKREYFHNHSLIPIKLYPYKHENFSDWLRFLKILADELGVSLQIIIEEPMKRELKELIKKIVEEVV